MWKWIILIIAGYALYRLFANDFLKKRKVNAKEKEKNIADKVAAGELVKDPECGTYVSKEGTITIRDGENIYHFCSYDCREKYLKKLKEGELKDLPQ